MPKNTDFFFLPLRSSHSTKDFKKQKQYSTISDTIEVGCNYSGDTKEVRFSLNGAREFSAEMLMLSLQGCLEFYGQKDA